MHYIFNRIHSTRVNANAIGYSVNNFLININLLL